MGILGRLAGFALVGPIGAVGPTEASKRSKKQLAEMQKQTHLLEAAARTSVGQATPLPSLPWFARDLLKKETAPHPFSPNPVHEKYNYFCSICGGPPDDHIPGPSLFSPQHRNTLTTGTRVVLVDAFNKKGVFLAPGVIGVAQEFVKWKGIRVRWDSGEETMTPPNSLVPLEAVHAAAMEMVPHEAGATGNGYKVCPDCAEEVRVAARKCRFCGYLFTDALVEP